MTTTRMRVTLLFVGLCLFLLAFLVMGFGYYLVSPVGKGKPDRVFSVREGMTFRQVTAELEKEGLIRSSSPLILWARVMGCGKGIKTGEYRLNPGMSPLFIMETLTKGAVVLHSVTLPEGITMVQAAELLAKEGLVDQERFLSLAEDPATAESYGISAPNLEGYLFPDTYYFSLGQSPETILEAMVRRFRDIVCPLVEKSEKKELTLEQVVTLASIVEKETGVPEERPLIASVFLNRLKRGMHLGSDPTVIYGLDDFDGNLTRKDLTLPTPYNTYLIGGLPPGPIANPGLDAIKAVLYPAETAYFYFVSKNDGSHFFSKTLLEHTRAVNYYQKKRGPKPKETP